MKLIFLFLFFISIYCLELRAVEGFHAHGVPGRFHRSPRRKRTIDCDADATYRTIDGTCNNLNNPLWGSAGAPLNRLVRVAYEDNVETPRVTATSGNPLPSAREVSLKCHPRDDALESRATIMVMHWGQFVDHDISLTPKGDEKLCPCDLDSLECMPIALSNDEYFAPRTCLEFKRSNWEMATDNIHSTPIRQQLNAITSFIDASNVYGSSDEQLAALRYGNSHELKVFSGSDGEDFMPPNQNAKPCRPDRGSFCFLAGDGRANVQPALGALHTLFVREHNRIANILKETTELSDETIFQDTRKIIGAMMQVITYKEFLPLVIGETYLDRYGLRTNSYTYDEAMNADVFNSFATAAFRFGHSQIPENLNMSCGESHAFKNLWLKPGHVTTTFDDLLYFGAKQKSTVNDRFFAHSVSRHLFQPGERLGSDLPALNIQRARDHGLPSYHKYREWCDFNNMPSLSDLFPSDPDAQAVYESAEDVDLFVGGMAENPLPGALVGKTFACLLGEQFKRLKNGDRFFYLTRERPSRFSSEQLAAVNRMKLSKIICANTNIKYIQKNVFAPSDPETNPIRTCDSLKPINLSPWSN